MKHVQAEIDSSKDDGPVEIDGKRLNATELWMPFLRQPLYPLLKVSKSGNKLTVVQAKNDAGDFVPFLHSPESELEESVYEWQYPMIVRYDTTGKFQSGF